MSSAICFNLDQSKVLSSGNGLILFGHVGPRNLLRLNKYIVVSNSDVYRLCKFPVRLQIWKFLTLEKKKGGSYEKSSQQRKKWTNAWQKCKIPTGLEPGPPGWKANVMTTELEISPQRRC